jgi:ADP-ribose pyrophosphatase YjhB (NUDIX family)
VDLSDAGGRRGPGGRGGAFPLRMLGLDLGGARFNLRAAGLAQREGHVLVNRLSSEPFCYLPGGRVELGETAAEALARELREELSLALTTGRLVFVVESFFRIGEIPFHEIAHYHLIDLPEVFPFDPGGGVCHSAPDTGGMLEFFWLPAADAALAEANFQPAALRDRLLTVSPGVDHLVLDELAGA